MKILKKVKTIVFDIDLIICNKCNTVIPNFDVQVNAYVPISYTYGFGHKKEGTVSTLDLCVPCFDKFIKTLKVKPEFKDALFE